MVTYGDDWGSPCRTLSWAACRTKRPTNREPGWIHVEKTHIFKPNSYPYDPWRWYIYRHDWVIFRANVGKYAIHGSFAICIMYK